MMRNNFCAFILSHGRSDRVYTYNLLKRHHYTGKIFIIVDDEDGQLLEYRKRFGEQVVMFSKEESARTVDEMDNFSDRRAILYARNVCFDLAERLGFEYFIELDDDYTNVHFRFDKNWQYTSNSNVDLDRVFDEMINFYNSSGALSITMAQGGDFLGGRLNNNIRNGINLKRKVMNTFICGTSRPFKFFGRMNDDVNTYVNLGSKGGLFFTLMQVCIEQKETQSNPGGSSEFYIENGTYLKSFYPILCNPSSVKIMMMGNTDRRIHHKIIWENTVPKILSERYKK